MAVQTAVRTVHGRGVADFSRAFNNPGKGASIVSWGAALDGFEMSFLHSPIKGAHSVNALQAAILGTRFTPSHDLSVVAQCGLWDDELHVTFARMSILGIVSDNSDASLLYLYNDGPLNNGSLSHTFPSAPAWATAVLSGVQMWFPGEAQQLQSATAAISDISPPGSTITCTLGSNFYGSAIASGNGGILYVAGPGSSPILISGVVTWHPGDTYQTATFTNLSFNSATAVLLLNGFNISFGYSVEHQVAKISMSIGNATTVINWSGPDSSGKWTATVSFFPWLWIQDDSWHQLDASSNVTVQVLLIPAA